MGAFDDLIPSAAPAGLFDDLVPAAKPKARPERSWAQAAADTGVQLAEGVNTIAGAIPNLVAPESGAARFFREGAEFWREKQSEPLKARIADADRRIDAAGEDGVIAQVAEAASTYFSDPALAARFVTTNLPSILPGLGAAKLAQAAALARGASAVRAAQVATTAAGAANAALNAGGARGEAFEDIKRTLEAQGLTPEEAEQRALADSRVVAAVGGVAGFVSGKTGLESSLFGKGTARSAVKAAAASTATELGGEQLEEVAPKVTTNVQAGRYDGRSVGKDVGRTVVETAIGSGPGAIVAGGAAARGARGASSAPTAAGLASQAGVLGALGAGAVNSDAPVETVTVTEPSKQQPSAAPPATPAGERDTRALAAQDPLVLGNVADGSESVDQTERVVAVVAPQERAAPAGPARSVADPTTRLAELEVLAGTRELAPAERAQLVELRAAVAQDGAAESLFADLVPGERPGAAPATPGVDADPLAPGARDAGASTPVRPPSGADFAQGGAPVVAGGSTAPGFTVPAGGDFWSFARAQGLAPADVAVGSPAWQALRSQYAEARQGTATPAGGPQQPANAQQGAEPFGGARGPAAADSGVLAGAIAGQSPSATPAPAMPVTAVPASGIDPTLQNRDRSRASSVRQMLDIARAPDYGRLGISRTPDAGAPMVFVAGDDVRVPEANAGRADVAVMADGQRVPFRYAVVDAAQVQTSHFADGTVNPRHAARARGDIIALNNGRTAGLRRAFEEGTAEAYRRELIADAAAHGVSPEAIARTPNPILVRIYADADNTLDMAAKSQGQALGMSPGELARQDAPLIDQSVLAVYEPGDVGSAGNRDLVRAFVGKLRATGQDTAAMMTADGTLSPAGRQRIQAAMTQAAFGDAELVEDLFDSLDTDVKAIGEALKTVAGEWASMRQLAASGAINPEVDITGNVLQAVALIRKARRDRTSLHDLSRQPDLMTAETPDALTLGALRIFYRGPYLTRAASRDAVIAGLRGYMAAALTTSAAPDMFGQTVTPGAILDSITVPGDTQNAAATTEEGRREPDRRGVAGQRAAPAGNAGAGPLDAGAGRRAGEDRAAQRGDAPGALRGADAGDAQGDQAEALTSRRAPEGARITPDVAASMRAGDALVGELRTRETDSGDVPFSRSQESLGLDAIRQAWAADGIDATLSERGGVVTVSKIVVPPDRRGQGAGTRAMQQLVDFADAAGLHIALTPSADFGGNKALLKQFYRRFGFVENKGRNRAFSVSESMVRISPNGPVLFSLAGGALRSLAHDAREPGNNANRTVDLGAVDDAQVEMLRARAGVDVSGYHHTADLYAVRHAINQHGNAEKEAARGQLAITDDDIARVARVIADPDAIVTGAKNRRGQDVIGYIRRNPDGTLLYVEEVRVGRKTLAMASVRKMPAARDFDSIARTLLSNARSDGGELIITLRDELTKFSRAPGGVQSVADVRRIADAMRARWANGPDVVVVADMNDERIPKRVRDADAEQRSQGATGEPEGFWYDGKAYLVASALGSEADVARVLAHEALGHYGLRGVFGDRLAPILDQIILARRAEVDAKVREYGLPDTRAGRQQAAEEVLAVMAQSQPTLGFVRRAVAAIRSWLRTTFPRLRMRLTDAEIIRDYILPARAFVERGAGRGDAGDVAFQRVWHGSPHTFDRFSAGAIGTGEGAQAYGWGLYFSGRREIGEHYRKALSGVELGYADDATRKRVRELTNFNDWAWDFLNRVAEEEGHDAAKVAGRFREHTERFSGSRSALLALAQLLEDGKLVTKRGGRLYEAEIPGDDEFLLWDKPLSEQPERIREAIYSAAPGKYQTGASGERRYTEPPQAWMTGGAAYARVSRLLGGDQAASQRLAELGVAGIKYLDGTSRGAGDGTFNYVVFDDSRVEIAAAFSRGQPAAPAKTAAERAEESSRSQEAAVQGEPAYSRSTLGGNEPPKIAPAQVTRWSALKNRVMRLTEPATIDRLIYEFQDKFVDLKRLRDHIAQLGGTVSDLNDAYLGEELYHARLATRTRDFLDNELRPLLAQMRSRGVAMEEFETFLHARHAPEANRVLAERNPSAEQVAEGREKAAKQLRDLELELQRAQAKGLATRSIEEAIGKATAEASRWAGVQAFRGSEAERLSLSGMTDDEAQEIMAALTPAKREDLETLGAMVDAMQARTLQQLEDYGLMDAGTLEAWRKTYRHYVPLHRDEARAESDRHPIGQGFSVKGQAARRRVGSGEKVTNILGHIAMQREAALTRGEKNQVVKRLYLLAAQNPDQDFWRLDEPPKVRTVDPATGFVRTSVDPQYKHLPNVVMLRIAGKDRAIVFNAHRPQAVRLAEAMKNLDVGDLHVVLGLAAKGTRWFAAVNTQYNPIFGLINFARDVQAGLLNLSTTALRGKQAEVAQHVPAAMRAIYRQRRGKGPANQMWGRLWAEFQDVGGITGYRDLYADVDERVKALTKELQALDRGRVSQAAHAVVDWLSHYSEAMENAVRLAAYKAALDEGMTRERAASLAKNLTVNFNRKGRQAREIGALYAFFNAAIQGTTRMAETLRGPVGRRIMYGGVLLGAVNAMIGMAMMGGGDGDEPDNWEKIPEFIKERSLVIPLGREDYATLPLPLGFHVLPNIGRVAVEFAMGADEKSAGRRLGELMMVLIDAFNPLGGAQNVTQMVAPTVVDPAVALLQNRDWTGRPIYRENMSDLDPEPGHRRAKDSASTPSKLIAEAINWITGGTEYRPGMWSPTPDQLDYVIGQLTGGLGRELMKVNQSIASLFTGDELPPYKVPLLGRLYGNTRGPSGESEKFYENLRELHELDNEIKGRRRNREDVDAVLQREPLAKLLPLALSAQGPLAEVRKLREQRRDILERKEPGYQERVREVDANIGRAMARLNADAARARRTATTTEASR